MVTQKFGTNKKGSEVKTVCFRCGEEKPKSDIQAVARKYFCKDCIGEQQ